MASLRSTCGGSEGWQVVGARQSSWVFELGGCHREARLIGFVNRIGKKENLVHRRRWTCSQPKRGKFQKGRAAILGQKCLTERKKNRNPISKEQVDRGGWGELRERHHAKVKFAFNTDRSQKDGEKKQIGRMALIIYIKQGLREEIPKPIRNEHGGKTA